MFRIQLCVCAVAFLGLASLLPAQAGRKKSEDKVKVTAEASKIGADGKQTVTVTIAIDKGWYIYANPVDNEDYKSNKTDVTFEAKEKVQATAKYPAGKIKTQKILKEVVSMRIYEGKVAIEAQVTRANGDTSPLQMILTINACDNDNCLPTGTIKLTVPAGK